MFEAHRWYRNGDHPNDDCQVITLDATRITDGKSDEQIMAACGIEPMTGEEALGVLTSDQFDRWCYLHAVMGPSYQPFWSEGKVVRYYRNPFNNETCCGKCGLDMHLHGWIEGEMSIGTAQQEGTTVCPGAMVITRGPVMESDTKCRYEVMDYAEFSRRYRQIAVGGCLYVEYGTRVIDPEHPYRQALSYHRRLAAAKLDDLRRSAYLAVARRLPWRLRESVVVVQTVQFSHDHPRAVVPEITAFDLLKGEPTHDYSEDDMEASSAS